MIAATRRGYAFTEAHPSQALDDLLEADPALERADQAAQLKALLPVLHPAPFKPRVLEAWAAWDLEQGLLEHKLDVNAAFVLPEGSGSRAG